MSTEETSEKQNTEVFYEESEAKDQNVSTEEGDKETKPTETEDQTTGDKDESKNKEESESDSESEAEGEGAKDSEADKAELKSADDLKVPDNAQLNAETVKEVYEQAKELGLNKSQAQAFLESRVVTDQLVEERAQLAVEHMKKQWLEDFKNDPEIGGDKALETAEHSKRFIDAYASDALKKVLDESPLGNHPEMLRAFAKAGKAMIANDSFISGKPVSTGKKSTADIFYSED